MNDEVKVRSYQEALDRVASDLAAAKLALEEVQDKIARGQAVDRSSIIDIHAFVNSILQAVLSLLTRSGPLQMAGTEEDRRPVESRLSGADDTAGSVKTSLHKISLKKVWHAGKQWRGGGVIGWGSALPEKGCPYQLRLEGGMLLETSPVQAVEEMPNACIIRTVNSVYELVRLEEIPQGSAIGEAPRLQPKKPMASAGKDLRSTSTTIEDKI
jgi:hypothetical protein